MRTKTKILLAVIGMAALLPLGTFAATQVTGRDTMAVDLNTNPQTLSAIESYLHQKYGDQVTTTTFNQPGMGSPYETFSYPSYANEITHAVPQTTLDTRAALEKMVKNQDIIKTNPTNCNEVFAYYFYLGDEVKACGPQGNTYNFPDLSIQGMDKRDSSFSQGFSSGDVTLYKNKNFSSELDWFTDDIPFFGPYDNDQASSLSFTI